MRQALRITAIFVLVVTLIGAGVFYYGIRTMTPAAEQISVTATPAVQQQAVFDAVMAQAAQQTFTGRLYGDALDLQAQDCTFLTYTVRLKNRGFFPAEWIALTVLPRMEDETGRDVLALPDAGAYVLHAGTEGDLSATILTTGDAQNTQRTLEVSCYVFGRKVSFQLNAQ
ncbi:MAG: hypothetical protein J6M47_10875 [Clostridia bacterium]|nr:hypothetical protein [Clostridia bacterium]